MNRPLKIQTDQFSPDIWQEVLKVCRLIEQAGGRAWLVGGSVRDALWGLPVRDFDLEVYNLDDATLRKTLDSDYRMDFVGQAYGIYKLLGLDIDVGLPRRESKTGKGHKNFEIVADPNLNLSEAAARRDFTINSIYYDPLTEEIQDPYNGQNDLSQGILRHTSPAFREDPLRVLRGMQFAARFELTVAPETVTECQSIDMEGLAPERVFWEWEKLILRGVKPSYGLQFLSDCGWIQYFPELNDLQGVPQDPQWHPEGDVWNHTLHCMDSFAEDRVQDHREDLVVGLAVLCHDFGKPKTTEIRPDKITSYGHDKKGEAPTRSFLGRMTHQADLVRDVVVLVVEHMRPNIFYRDKSSDAAIRRLADRVGRIDRLVRVAKADVMGRPPLPEDPFPAGPWLLAQAWRLKVCNNRPEPLVLGRHLIELGYSPSEEFKKLLERCYQAQLSGDITNIEEGKKLIRREFEVPEKES